MQVTFRAINVINPISLQSYYWYSKEFKYIFEHVLHYNLKRTYLMDFFVNHDRTSISYHIICKLACLFPINFITVLSLMLLERGYSPIEKLTKHELPHMEPRVFEDHEPVCVHNFSCCTAITQEVFRQIR